MKPVSWSETAGKTGWKNLNVESKQTSWSPTLAQAEHVILLFQGFKQAQVNENIIKLGRRKQK